MMKNKKILVSLLSLAMVGSIGGALAYTASANTVEPDALQPATGEFEMKGGASARVNSVGDSGIRFETVLSEEWVKEIKTKYATAQLSFGTLIAPTENIKGDVTKLTSATQDVQTIVHNPQFKNGEATLSASVTYDKAKLVSEYEALYQVDLTEKQETALMESVYDAELTARAYCTVNVGGTEQATYYAISNDNSRTARRVINAAVLDNTLTDTNIINKYLTSVEQATAYADLDGDVVFDNGTAGTIYVGASANALALDNGYTKWTDLVDKKNVGDSITVSTIVKGKVTHINVSVIDNVITKASELSALNNTNAEVNNKTYALGKNLDASAVTMAHDNGTGAGFGGLFDGKGHTISNLNVGSGSGLFGEFVEGATVQNLALYDITVNGGFYLAENNPKYTMKNVYVKLTEESTNPKGISKMTNTQVLQNVVVEYTGENAVKQPTSKNSTGWDKYGVLCWGLGFKGDSSVGYVAEDYYFENVYVISPSHIMKGSLSGFYCYGINETKDIWGGDIWNEEKNNGVKLNFGEGGDPTGANRTYYYNVPFSHTYHYDSYAEMAKDANNLDSFDGKYWVVNDGQVYWKDIYLANVAVVATDEAGEEIETYQLQTTTDEINLSMVDMYGNKIDGVEYMVANNDGKLQNVNGTFSLTATVAEDKAYAVTAKAVVKGVVIERSITINAVVAKTTYAQEVYIATNSDYNGADEYVLTNTNLTVLPEGITKASLNGVELLINDGKLPDITMSYVKKFSGTYAAQVRETYMDIWASRGNSLDVIAEKKDTQAPLTLTLTTDSGIIEFTNLFVCTDVIQVATDLNRFSITYREKVEDVIKYNNDGYYVMTNNIDAKDLAFKHKNNTEGASRRFLGAFDGRGYTISNLNVNQSVVGVTGNTEVYGLFGNLYGADIINVGFVNVSAEGGSVLGSHTSYLASSNLDGETLLYAENIYPHLSGSNIYAATRIENVYIQVADSVTAMKGALCPTLSDRNVVKNVVVEWNPTNATPLTSGYGSLVGSGTWSDGEKPTRANIVVLSSVQLNNNMATCSGVTTYADRATMETQHTASLASFATYWTTTSNAPVWNTANWQKN